MVVSAARYAAGAIKCVFETVAGAIKCVFETVVVGDPEGLGKCRVIVNVLGCTYVADSG